MRKTSATPSDTNRNFLISSDTPVVSVHTYWLVRQLLHLAAVINEREFNSEKN